MIVNNIPRPNVDKLDHAEYIARQVLDIKRADTIKMDEAPRRALEKIQANARIEQAYIQAKELEELKLYTAHNKRQDYYDYRRILFVGLNFDRYS
jgi:hypothetical protein